MNKKILMLLAIFCLSTQLFAGGDIAPVEPPHAKETSHDTDVSNVYLIVKALTILGNNVTHGDATLDSDQGYGFGIDLGYRIGNGFALEYDFSYATNTVTETDEHHTHEADAKYYTHTLDLVYTYHLSHTLGVFAKAGYEYEKEEIDELHIDAGDTGFAYGVGLEYELNNHYTLVVEYENSRIEAPRGAAVLAGVMYSF